MSETEEQIADPAGDRRVRFGRRRPHRAARVPGQPAHTRTSSIWATRPTSPMDRSEARRRPPARVRGHGVSGGLGGQADRRGLQFGCGCRACRNCRRPFRRRWSGWSCRARARRCRRHASDGSGIMATEATIRSNAYQNALQSLDAGLEVFPVACPRLAPLIQDGDVFSEETRGGRPGVRRAAEGGRSGHGHSWVHTLSA